MYFNTRLPEQRTKKIYYYGRVCQEEKWWPEMRLFKDGYIKCPERLKSSVDPRTGMPKWFDKKVSVFNNYTMSPESVRHCYRNPMQKALNAARIR